MSSKAKTMRSGQCRGSARFAALRREPRPPQTPQELAEPISPAAAALTEALSRSDLTSFYAAPLRITDLPFLCAQRETKGLVGSCAAILHRLGGISPAAGLAVENRLYVTGALATFPKGNTVLELKCRKILDLIGGERLLVANTNSKVHADRLGAIGTLARRAGQDLRVDVEYLWDRVGIAGSGGLENTGDPNATAPSSPRDRGGESQEYWHEHRHAESPNASVR